MADPIRCFFLQETNFYRKELRRYRPSYKDGKHIEELPCSAHGYHTTSVVIEPLLELAKQPCNGDDESDVPHSDPRWPKQCDCGNYVFWELDLRQINYQSLYRRSDTGELVALREAPPGAIWDAHWMAHKVSDGHYYCVKLPNGHDWAIDSRASNCTRPNEPHQCWVRHGVPPDLHVDKNGDTCAAGAGSIDSGAGTTSHWHGFLHHGHLVTC
jgi:hypothetical protein